MCQLVLGTGSAPNVISRNTTMGVIDLKKTNGTYTNTKGNLSWSTGSTTNN